MLALVIDINRFVEVYLGPAMNEMSDARLVVGLATPEFGVRMGPGRAGVTPTPADAHNHVEPQGTITLDDAGGRRLHAWAKLDAADETWMVASSAPYSLVAGQIRRSATAQLGLTAMLLVALPLVGWLIARRERQIQQEQRNLERRLAESQKMEAIGKLAGGVAHDFNNMLTAILGYSTMIQEDAPPQSAMRDQALQVRRAAENAAALTQKLLAFSRKQVLQSDPVDLAIDARQPAAALPQRRRRGRHRHHADGRGPLADPRRSGAGRTVDSQPRDQRARCDAEGRHVADRGAQRAAAEGERRPDADVKPGDYVQITVTDTGIGMDEATRARMFEPFFTTKAPGKGTGLGLSTVYGFVRQCGGYIDVVSTPGQGTSIELLLPRARTSVTAPDAGASTCGPDPRRRRTPCSWPKTKTACGNWRRIARAPWVSRDGGRERGGSVEARGAFDGTIHLLLSDVVMPGMKGPELADRLRALRPGIRVLLMSGYAADVVTPSISRRRRCCRSPLRRPRS